MKAKLFLTLVALLMLGLNVQAQRGGDPEQHLQMMQQKLDLTETQMQTIRAGMEDVHARMATIYKDENLSEDQRHEEMAKLHKEMMGKFKAILSPEQLEKMKEMRAQRGNRGPHGRHGPRGMHNPDLFAEVLKARLEFDALLSEREQATIAGVREAVKEMRESCEAAEERPHHKGMREEMKALMAPLDPIVQAHQSELDRIREDLKAKRESVRGDKPAGNRRGHMKPAHMNYHFLLMDPQNPGSRFGQAFNSVDMTVYPNPARSNTSVVLEAIAEAEIVLVLRDSEGNLVRELISGPMGKGKQLYSLNLDGLNSGVYFLQLSYGDQMEVEKLVVVE